MGVFGPSFMTVWQQGVPVEGRIVGIRRSQVSEDESTVDLGLGSRSAMLGLATVAQARVRFSDGTEALVDKFVAPFYASHLGAVGDRLPALQHPRDARKIRIDWPAAALAAPGLGVAALAPGIAGGPAAASAMGAGGADSFPGFGKGGLIDRMQAKVTATAKPSAD